MTKGLIHIPGRNRIVGTALLCLMVTAACEDFVDVKLARSKVTSDVVFSDNNTAESAVIGIYHDLVRSVITTGSKNSLSRLAGLSADELSDYNMTDGIVQFERNELNAENTNVLSIWQALYRTIYQANLALEGLTSSSELSSSVKDRLLGEAMFLRAFSNFYLVSLFGDVPLVTSSDYRKNATAARSPVQIVYQQIVNDLLRSQELLPADYQNNERLRPTKSGATALLARVYLYLGDWENAALQATAVIENDQYGLLSNLNGVFLKNSREAIWQLPPIGVNSTSEAQYYVITQTSPKYLVLREGLVNAFEAGDNRASNWVGTFHAPDEVLYFPHKYKGIGTTAPVTEYVVVLRLAEQYLIRAEARAHQGDLFNAIMDLDMIRHRAGLALIQDTQPQITKEDLLMTIMRERQLELFTEWGHRWFDLKRTGSAGDILANAKIGFTPEDQLYPIPRNELDRNPGLGDQNPGY